ncbi:MAG: FHA domain-containing protein [Planctomycetes bacterium]|nr:FHA domain-containing protein [Planctomycetota bacterium]
MQDQNSYSLKVADAGGEQGLDVELTPGEPMTIGRLPTNPIPVSWDREISREHATLTLENGQVRVACLERARNPIIFGRAPVREATVFAGQQFQIGQTVFQLEAPVGDESSQGLEDADVDEFQFSDVELNKVEFSDAGRQMELLCDLPEMISSATSDADLGQLLAGLLLDAVPEAVAIAVAHYDDSTVDILRDQDPSASQAVRPQIMRVRTRECYEGRFLPSRKLLGPAF